jgi:succinate dehydrogenase/fumarate reductase-like Fe-S protein
VINGVPHGPEVTTTCQLHMRSFSDGDVIDVEPWRSGSFPVIKDLVVNRGAFDRIIQAGGYISAPTGSAPDAHATPSPSRTPTGRSTPPRASSAAPASRPARTARRCCSPRRR